MHNKFKIHALKTFKGLLQASYNMYMRNRVKHGNQCKTQSNKKKNKQTNYVYCMTTITTTTTVATIKVVMKTKSFLSFAILKHCFCNFA